MQHMQPRCPTKDPPPFSREFRPGFAEALAREYEAYCDDHPAAGQVELAAAHREIARRLTPLHPRWEEAP